jgi:hypothetical protein
MTGVRQRDLYSYSVFINCPFSPEYQPIFQALLFSVYACGYRPRGALEISDSTQNKLSKIEGIIQQCRFGIHDISFVSLDRKTKLPRFNMPFELGLFFGAKLFGPRQQKRKIALKRSTTYGSNGWSRISAPRTADPSFTIAWAR